MNRHIRLVAFVALLLIGMVFLKVNYIQLVKAEEYAGHEENLRTLLKEYSVQRGPIIAADGQTVVAESVPTPKEQLKYLRGYPTGPLFAHVTGFYSFIYARQAIENRYNSALTGQGGVLTMQDLGDSLLRGGRRGDSVYISIHPAVQQAATEALGPRRGAVVAIDPATGAILAMAAFPSFDPNVLSSHDAPSIRQSWTALQADGSRPLLNRATSEAYPPGSTFKIVTAAAALEHDLGVDTRFPSTAEFKPPQTDQTINNFGNRACGGDMAEALRVSCNTYFAQLGAGLSGDDFAETASAFGFTEKPPLDISAARSGLPSDEELASPAFRAQAAIGQFEVRATPLQMALVAAAVANKGEVPKPTLLQKIVDARGQTVEESKPAVWKRAMTETSAAILRNLMVDVVEEGTGRNARIQGVEVGGKTGTAQAGQEGADPHVWFVAFAGTGDPRIAVAVIVENGGDLGSEATGGAVAAPIAKSVIEAHRGVAGW